MQVKAGSGDASSPWSAVNGTSLDGIGSGNRLPDSQKHERHGEGWK